MTSGPVAQASVDRSHVAFRASVICPQCWHQFPPADTLAIARHPSLGNDPVTGGALRFLPSRFTANGNPLDPTGDECLELACPRCHLSITRVNLSAQPLFASIVGGPASGKSYLLAAATWMLRQTLPKLGWAITDASPLENAIIQANEQRLFLAADQETPAKIEKTDEGQAHLFSTIFVHGRSERLLKPFQFLLKPISRSSNALQRVLVLYDNPGEHFLPGSSQGIDASRHLGQSKVLLFVLDPLADPRLRSLCRADESQVQHGTRVDGYHTSDIRQELILNEVAARIAKLKGLRPGEPIGAGLIVLVTKADLCPPLVKLLDGESFITKPPQSGLAIERMKVVSRATRDFLKQHCPELVATAQSMSAQPLFLPVSALGASPVRTQASDGSFFFGIAPRNVKPKWAEAPFLAALHSLDPEIFPNTGMPASASGTAQDNKEPRR